MRSKGIIAAVALVAIFFAASQTDFVRSGLTAAVASILGSDSRECPALESNMRYGATDAKTGAEVSELQRFLAAHFELEEKDLVTGFYGMQTKGHVAEFQKQRGLPATGIVATLTRAAIFDSCEKPAAVVADPQPREETVVTAKDAPPTYPAPTCTLSTAYGAYRLGKSIEFYWNSEHATSSRLYETTEGVDRLPFPTYPLPAVGREYVKATVVGDRTVVLEVSGAGGTGTCKKTIPVFSN